MCALENGMKLQKRQVSRNPSVGRFHLLSTRLGGDAGLSRLGPPYEPSFSETVDCLVISGTCVVAHDTAATWLMNMLTPSPFLISVLSTVASLPFFLFTLPACALADIVDRKKLICLVQPLVGWRGGRPSDPWLAAFSQSLCDPDFRVSYRSRFRSECPSLDVERV